MIGNHFINQSCLLASRRRLQLEHLKGLLCNKGSNKQGYRRNQHNNCGNSHIFREHKKQGSENRNYTCK